jgi:hypothetical protein
MVEIRCATALWHEEDLGLAFEFASTKATVSNNAL